MNLKRRIERLEHQTGVNTAESEFCVGHPPGTFKTVLLKPAATKEHEEENRRKKKLMLAPCEKCRKPRTEFIVIAPKI